MTTSTKAQLHNLGRIVAPSVRKMAVSETKAPHSVFLRHGESKLSDGKDGRRRALIYFICGNPGLIEFYNEFLGHLQTLVRESTSINDTGLEIDFYGRNLAGFADDEHHPFSSPHNVPVDLEGQICAIYDDIAEVVRVEAQKNDRGEGYEDVILMGHSVGAYIATEIMHRHLTTPSAQARHVHMRHGFLLFPTLTHIASSPSGRRMQLLRNVPFMDSYFHLLARGLLGMIPESAVRWLVSRVVRVEDVNIVGVLTRWLKSRDGVWQAVHLGKSEMETIREELWEERLWGTVEAADREEGESGTPRFFILYGKEDHWVANHHRDEFIARRQRNGGETRIEVDEGDLPHAFCLKEDDFKQVAETVLGWLEEIEDGRP